MANFKVRKRNGELVPADIQKIKYMLGWAAEGLEVNPLKLESSLSVVLKDGISTKEIHDNSVYIASSLISTDEPDWRYVAGRLHISGYVKDVAVSRGFGYGSTKKFFEYQHKRGVYGDYVVNLSEKEFEFADHLIDPERDMLFDLSGAITLSDRYCLNNELPQEMFLTIALVVAKRIESLYDYNFYDWATKIYDYLSNLELSASTPILLNLRRPNPNLFSCFIIKPSDNMDSIYNNVKDLAIISKNAGGVGINLDSIRSDGSWIKNAKGAASGVIPLIKVLNDTAVYVNQEGKRSGAVSPSISAWHLDLLEFYEIQLEEGDQRTKSFDVFPQVVFNDLFYERVEADGSWTMFDPYEVKKVTGYNLSELYEDEFKKVYEMCEALAEVGELQLHKTVRARGVQKAHYKAMSVNGMPYIAFKDAIYRGNPNKHDGHIYGANVCVESFSNFSEDTLSHTCNLVSTNVARCIGSTLEKTLDKIYSVSKVATIFLDSIIDLAEAPIKSSKDHNDRYRTVGVGALGLADLMAYYGKSFEKEDGVKFGSTVIETISLGAVTASTDLAEKVGSYPAFEGSEWSKGNLLGREWEDFKKVCTYKDVWRRLRKRVMKNGIRNGQLMAIAPNSSTGILQGVTPSILPAWKLLYVETTQIGSVIRMPLFVKERALMYKPYPYTDMEKMIDFVAAIMPFIDSGVSFELVLDLTNSEKSGVRYWNSLVQRARKKGLKTLYYTRFLTQDGIEEIDEGCIACRN